MISLPFCTYSVNESALSLDDCAELIRTLHDEFYEEYKLYGLSSAVLSTALPLVRMCTYDNAGLVSDERQCFLQIKEQFRDWSPLDEQTRGVDLLAVWRELLEESRLTGGIASIDQMDPYHRLIWETWMPVFRKAVA